MKFAVRTELLQLFRIVGAKGENFELTELMDFLKEYIKLNKLYDPVDPFIIDISQDPLGSIFNTARFSVARARSLLMTCLTGVNQNAGCVNDEHYLSSVLAICESLRNHQEAITNLFLALSNSINAGEKVQKVGDAAEPEKLEETGEKRKHSDTEDDVTRKRSIALQSASPIFFHKISIPEYDSSSETILSIQGYETALAKDSSDESLVYDDDDDITEPPGDDNFVRNASSLSDCDSLSLLPSDEEFGSSLISDNDYSFEYEVSSVIGSVHSDSDSGDTVIAEFLQLVTKPDENDVEFWADLSNCEDVTSDDMDYDITDLDKWLCKHCSCLNWPTMRFCQKCWQLRVNWLPDQKRRRPPKRLRRKRKKMMAYRISPSKNIPMMPQAGSSSGDFDVIVTTPIIESSLSSSNCSSAIGSSATIAGKDEQSEKTETSGTSEEVSDNVSSQSTEKDAKKLCILCMQQPRNACFIHGTSGHMISCFFCARKLWQQGQPCPTCRRTIQKVVRVYSDD